MRWRYAALATVAACGRVGFSPTEDASPSGPDAALLTGLLGWWKLDEASGTVAHDSIGSDDGTLVGSLSFANEALANGTRGDALLLTGSNARVQLDAPGNLDNLPGFSLVAWVQPTSIAVRPNGCIFDHGNGDPDSGWYLLSSATEPGDLQFYAGYTSNYMVQASVGGALPVGTWGRVVATWDGVAETSHVHLYVDAHEVLYSTPIDPTGPRADDSMNTVNIGCNDGGLGSFPGSIYDARIYDHALSPAEVGLL